LLVPYEFRLLTTFQFATISGLTIFFSNFTICFIYETTAKGASKDLGLKAERHISHNLRVYFRKKYIRWSDKNLQENKGFQFPKRWWYSSHNIVLVQVKANKIFQVTKFRWNHSLDVILVKFPAKENK
jgi:hypothetical protein